MAAVTFASVSRRFPGATRNAVDALNLEIADGEFLVLVGPSGCGKTTTLRMLAGLDPVDEGHILIGDDDVTEVAPKDRDIAMVFQNYALYPHLTVEQNMGFGLKTRGVAKAERQEKVREAAKLLDLEPLLHRRPSELSGGQRQRVAIARALALEPEFVVLDEAVSALDVSVQAQILKLLDELQDELGLSYLFITHDLGVVAESADTVAVIQHGKMLEYGPTADIFTHPQSDYTRKLLDAVPSL